MAEVLYEGECCEDCAQYIANGETPVDMSEEAAEVWLAHVVERNPKGNAYLTCNSSEECTSTATCEAFSYSPCGYCGSRLGGARHSFAVLG